MSAITNKNAQDLASHVMEHARKYRVQGGIRTRFELIDRAVQREADRTKTAIQSHMAASRGQLNKIPDFEIPLGFIQYESALAWLASIFATGQPMFRSVSSKELEKVSSMMNGLIHADQTRFGWTGQTIKFLGSLLRYNIGAMEVDWKRKTMNGVTTSVTDGSSQTAAVQTELYQGNALKFISPYNLIHDPTCEISEVHEVGSFNGYIDKFNYVRLKRFVNDLDRQYLIREPLKTIFKDNASYTNGLHYVPKIRLSDASDTQRTGTDINWSDFFGVDSHNVNTGDGYEVITMYERIIPIEFGMKVPQRGTPQVWKVILVNGVCIYAEPIVAGHGYLGIVLTQAYDEGFGMQNKSFVENVMPLQQAGTAIVKGTMGAMRRATLDRGLYNPAMIRSDDINAPDETGKIPVKMNKFNANFAQAYQPLDFRDNITPQFNQNLGLVFDIANQINGVNQAQQGNFVKGNKTLFEFDTVMSKADSRLQLMAMHIESSGFFPIKQMIKINYLINSTEQLLVDPTTGQEVEINPDELRKKSPDLRMADGLIPATKLGNTEVMMAALQLMGQIPEMGMEWNIPSIAVSILRHQGFDEIDSYKRTPQEQQQYAQNMAVMNGQAQAQAGAPEDGQPQQ